VSPTATTDAIDTDAIRGRGDMSHLSRGQDVAVTSALGADVTIVIRVTHVISDPLIGMHL
jgi:hypothetical protein